MAPRARPKTGLRRIDAAIDAMKPYGFSENLVKSTIKELLEVYGGDDGWTFIEEFSYNVLLQGILEKQDEQSEEKDGPGPSDAGPSNMVIAPSGSNAEVVPIVSQADEALATEPLTIIVKVDDKGSENPESSDTGSSNIIALGAPCSTSETMSFLLRVDESSHVSPKAYESSLFAPKADEPLQVVPPVIEVPVTSTPAILSEPAALSPPTEAKQCPCKDTTCPVQPAPTSSQVATTHPRQKRRPCHGWLSSDDDDEEMVHLKPAPLPKALSRRPSRWDIAPERMGSKQLNQQR